jgi:hypothetical protein
MRIVVFLRLMCLDEAFGIGLENSVVIQKPKEPFNLMCNISFGVEEIEAIMNT